MRTQILLATLASGLVLGFALGLAPQEVMPKPAAPPTAPAAPKFAEGAFTIDPVHSSLIFKIQHQGVGNFYGRFNEISGTYWLDAADPAGSSMDVQVKTQSLDTNNKKRDSDVLSPGFFNATEFPTISFKGTKVSKASDTFTVAGDLTFHGVTKPITVAVTPFAAKPGRGGKRSGFETTFTIKRSDYGVDSMVANGGLGDDVQITVSVEGTSGGR